MKNRLCLWRPWPRVCIQVALQEGANEIRGLCTRFYFLRILFERCVFVLCCRLPGWSWQPRWLIRLPYPTCNQCEGFSLLFGLSIS